MKKGSLESYSSCPPSQKQNQYLFSIDNNRTLLISSLFQAGNMALVKQVNELHYILEALSDVDHVPSRKAWLYFKIKSQKGIKVRMVIQNVNIFQGIFEDRGYVRPMMREGLSGQWTQTTNAFLTYRDDLMLIIDHTFSNSTDQVFFCLSVPHTYSQCEAYLSNLAKYIHPNISYSDELLTKTQQQRNVHLLTITEKGQNTNNSNTQERKPVILVTARVHPGQVSSSYCLQGFLDFLLSYYNLQAYILRRLFIFKVVPMVNPDGVATGNYRTDPLGHNLNRFYLDPHPQQHPPVHKIVELVKSITTANQKIQFYFDLHSHSGLKESFIYGNAFDDIVSQTYSQTYCKILEENFPRFRAGLSNFGENHMKHKDRGESLTKEGCGRVVISKMAGIVCSYTLESSVFPSSYEPFINKVPKNEQKNLQYFLTSPTTEQTYSYQPILTTASSYQNILVTENRRLGKSLLLSILDMLEKNPYSRMTGMPQNYLSSTFKNIGSRLLQSQDRFKLMDVKAYHKVRNIAELIKGKMQEPLDREWTCTGDIAKDFNQVQWPSNVRKIKTDTGLIKTASKSDISKKKLRMKTQGGKQIKETTSFIQRSKKIIKGPLQITKSAHKVQNHPQPSEPVRSFLPQIKYSVEMKPSYHIQGSSLDVQSRTASIKQLAYAADDFEPIRAPKRLILDYITDEITKISPDRSHHTLKRANHSLNRLIANKLIDKEKKSNKGSQLSDYAFMMIQSRKRISTEFRQQGEEQKNEDGWKGLQLKKAQIVKKRLMLTNKAVEILKKGNNDKPKIKLPEVSKINLIVENSLKQHKNNYFQSSNDPFTEQKGAR